VRRLPLGLGGHVEGEGGAVMGEITRQQKNMIRRLKRAARDWPEGIELEIVGMGTIRVVAPLSCEEIAAWETDDQRQARKRGVDMENHHTTPQATVLATISIPCTIGATG
jgi:hypothetical protein